MDPQVEGDRSGPRAGALHHAPGWVPFSARFRAERAFRAGRYEDALRLFARLGDRARVAAAIHDVTNDYSLAAALGSAADTYFDLREMIDAAAVGRAAPAWLIDDIEAATEATAATLWSAVGRIAVVVPGASGWSPRMLTAMKRYGAMVADLRAAFGDARDSLAEFLLGPKLESDADRVREVLTRLTVATKALHDGIPAAPVADRARGDR